jgi:glutamate racemase
MSTSSSIGIFDSGIGGLSILDKIHQLLPNENLLYLADSDHAPYGPRGEDYIQQRCRAVMDFFLQQEVKAVVLACNTATAAAVAMLREEYQLPIIGMEPAIKPAAMHSRSGVVGVLATEGTIDSDKFMELKSQYSDHIEIITKACPGLVEHIEQISPDRQAILALLNEFTLPLVSKGADTLVLGCTHYSAVTELIAEVVGEKIKIIDTGFAVAEELKRRLRENNLEGNANSSTMSFYSTGDIDVQQALISHHWGRPVQVSSV